MVPFRIPFEYPELFIESSEFIAGVKLCEIYWGWVPWNYLVCDGVNLPTVLTAREAS